jgi:hypothetical protein
MYWRLILILAIPALAAMCAARAQGAELRISNLEDVDFGVVAGTANRIQQHVRICVSSTPAGPYQLTALGATAAGDFKLSSGGTAELDYSVLASPRGRGRSQPMSPGVPMGGFMAKEPRANGACQPPFSFVIIEIDPTDVQSAPGGQYNATLQLIVAPE